MVEVDAKARVVRAIGGNVQDGVAMTIAPINSKGLLTIIKDVRDWKVVVQNKLAIVHDFPLIDDDLLKNVSSKIECSRNRMLDNEKCAKGATEGMKRLFEKSEPLEQCRA